MSIQLGDLLDPKIREKLEKKVKKPTSKKKSKKPLNKINENKVDPYEVAKALIGTEARNKVYNSFGISKDDYEMNDRIKNEVEVLIKLGW